MFVLATKVLLGASLLFGFGHGRPRLYEDLTPDQQAQLIQASEKAITGLSEESKNFILVSQSKGFHQLSEADQTKLRKIFDEIETNTLKNITDAKLKAKVEQFYKDQDLKREQRSKSKGKDCKVQ